METELEETRKRRGALCLCAERKETAKRHEEHYQKLRDEGFHAGPAPFGFRKVPFLLPDEKTAPIVLSIFGLHGKGYDLTKLSDFLNLNHPGYDWTPGKVGRILEDRTYFGEIKDGAGGWKPGKHEALIS